MPTPAPGPPNGVITVSDLTAKLPAFAAAVRRTGAGPSQVSHYLTGVRVFLRWLAGEGPHPRPPVRNDPDRTRRLLEDLGRRLDRRAITAALEAYERAVHADGRSTSPEAVLGRLPDLAREEDRAAVMSWMRAWRAQRLRDTDSVHANEALEDWWEAFSGRLPPPDTELESLPSLDLGEVERAYDALARAPVRPPGASTHRAQLLFGDTAASRVMAAVRPRLFVSWHREVRWGFGWWRGGGDHYVELLTSVAAALHSLAERLGSPVGGLPALLGRPGDSPAQVADAYLWITITRGFDVGTGRAEPPRSRVPHRSPGHRLVDHPVDPAPPGAAR